MYNNYIPGTITILTMRKFLITSNRFNGTAAIIYNSSEVLCKIDCSDTDMNADTISKFKRMVPATITDLQTPGWISEGTTVVETGYRISFDAFWQRYNKKINKARCIPLYEKLNDADTIACYNGIKAYDKFLLEIKVRQKLDPENWIKQRAWENEYK